MSSGKFDFESYGIGELLRRGPLAVPANQRPYKWGEPQVENLLLDLNEAILGDEEDYFLGTIVLIQKGVEMPSIVDGQQRIVTTSVLLARIRDKQAELKRLGRAESIEKSYLRDIDLDTEERVSRLQLNVEDNQFYQKYILSDAGERAFLKSPSNLRASNRRLAQASSICERFLENELKNIKPDGRSDHLNRWVTFIKNNASVVVVKAPDEVGAFRMFETLNDRGLKAGAADILKNYFFSRSGKRLPEAQSLWNSITTAIESLGEDEDDRLVTFLRHFWVVSNGPTKERELARRIKTEITGETRALSFLERASRSVDAYVALWSAQHPLWSEHRSATRNAVDTIANQLKVEQIRPLMFAVALHFDPKEVERAFKLFVSWSVRFLVFGGRGGMLDEQYSRRAQDVGTGKITTAKQLRDVMQKYVPSDAEFEAAFSGARVSRLHLAKYYLRSIDKFTKDDKQPSFVTVEDVDQLSLDHVLPLSADSEWDTDGDELEVVQKMIGNMVLLKPLQNRLVANASFAKKREVYENSGYNVTRMVVDHKRWGAAEIKRRQAELARLAVATWPITVVS